MKKKSTSKLAFFSIRVLPSLVAAAFIALALALSNSVGDTSSCPPPQTAQWPSAPTPTPTPLTTDFYFLPDLSTPKPVLVLRGCNAASATSTPCYWGTPTPNPYHIVIQDIRGSPGCSNTPTPFIGDLLYKYDQDDGHTLLGYINGELWGRSGSLAMYGWSNGGITSYLAAVGADTYLRGIQPHYATGDLLNYGLFNGGVWHKEIPYPVDLPQAPNQISWKDYVGLGIWDKYLIDNYDAGRTKVAGLHVGGWFDVFGQATLDSFSRMQGAGGTGALGHQKVVIGPWIHGGEGSPPVGQIPFPNSTIDHANFSAYDAAWKQCVLQQPPNCTAWYNNTLPAVKVYLMNADPGSEWLTYTTWPPPGVKFHYYFTSDNPPKLSTTLPSSGQLTFTSDPSNPCPTLGGTNNLTSCTYPSPVPSPLPSPIPCGPWDQRPIEGRSDVVVFTSDALTSAGATVGRIHADVWIQTALPDVDVVVRMTDVYPDGRSMLMAEGIQRARYRNGGACPQPLVRNARTRVRVDLGSTALVIKAGHKVRVIVSASAGPNEAGVPDFPARGGYSVNPQNGQEYIGFPNANQKGAINVLTGGTFASELVLSVPGGSNPQPDERPPKPTPCPP
jgi:predicted acyl esterase